MPDIQEDPNKVKQRAQDLGLVKSPKHEDFSLDEPSLGGASNPSVAKDADAPWNMESFDPIDEFKEKSFSESTARRMVEERGGELILDEPEAGDQEWVKRDLSHFQVDPKVLRETTPSAKFDLPDDDLGADLETSLSGADLVKPEKKSAQPPPLKGNKKPNPLDDDLLELEETPGQPNHPIPTSTFLLNQTSAQSPEQMEALVREAIQDAVWKIVPELAAQMIEKELNRLLKEEASP